MSATNIVETIKRRFGVLAGTAIGLLVGILILYACENTVSHSPGHCVTNKKLCSTYSANECPSAAYEVSMVHKNCKSKEDSNTTCVEITVPCWGIVPCKVIIIEEDGSRKCSTDFNENVNWQESGSSRVTYDCPSGYSGSGGSSW